MIVESCRGDELQQVPPCERVEASTPSDSPAGASRLRELLGQSCFVTAELDQPLQAVVDRFSAQRDCLGALVCNGERFVCLISQAALNLRMSRGFFRDLFMHRPVRHLLDNWSTGTLCLPADTNINKAIAAALARPASERYEPIVVIDGNEHAVIDLHHLLAHQCRALEHSLEQVQQQRQQIIDAANERDRLNARLVSASRQAGMAEIATSVLHNVGNVLNSVNVSTHVVEDKLRDLKVESLGRVVAMLTEHEQDLASFLTGDPKGRQLPQYMGKLSAYLRDEQKAALEELGTLARSVDHLQQIISAQQSFARGSILREDVELGQIIEDALRINEMALARHGVKVERTVDFDGRVYTDKHKLLQILVNLVSNAKKAVRDSGRVDRRVAVSAGPAVLEGGRAGVFIEVRDNGVGIAPEHLSRIFTHGFTTRDDGHGFGLHSAANDARAMGGELSAQSDGLGAGATFRVVLPLEPAAAGEARP